LNRVCRLSITSFLLIAALVGTLNGCSLHKPVRIEPRQPVPQEFSSLSRLTVGKTSFDSLTPWWKSFGNKQLDRLIEQGLRENLDIKAGIARLLQARALVKAARSSYFPSLSAEYQISRTKQPGYFGQDVGTNYRMSVAASYELDLWRRIASGVKAARFEQMASEQDLLTLYMGTSAQVAELYFFICAKHKEKKLTKEEIEALEIQLSISVDQYQQGLVEADEVLEARNELAKKRALNTQIEQDEEKARYALSILIGRYPEYPFPFTISPVPPLEKSFPAGISAAVIQNRPDVRAAYLRIKASDARVAQAIADLFPTANLMAQFGRSSTAISIGKIVGSFWSVAFSAAMSVFDAGKRSAEVQRARAKTMEAMALYHKTILQAFKEVEDALMDNWAARELISELEKEQRAYEELYELAMDRYVSGLSDYLPVIKSKVGLIELQRQLVIARYQAISSRISLYRCLGGVWMRPYLNRSLRGLKNG